MVFFHINADTLPPSEAFPYLGRTITYNNRYWVTVYLDLRKARWRWGTIARVLESKGETVRDWGEMYKAVAQSVLLYGRESWVVTGEMLKSLTEFHHWAEQRITGITEKCRSDGEWEKLEVEEAMDATGLHPIRVYKNRRKNTISERLV